MFNKIFDDVTNFFKGANKYVVNGKEYIEEKLIGEGGYGYVYVVVDPSVNQKLALKKMNIISKEANENFKREIELWLKIKKHENIVKLIDYEIRDKTVFIVMELCSEGTLLEYINNTTNLIPEKQIIYILSEISNALLVMHTQDKPIAHRDLKIENVLKFGNRLKLCDFGSASTQTMDPNFVDKNFKYEQFAIYEKTTTFMYRPPEMCDQYSKYKVNEKVDIWMLGCIMYTLIYKKHPFADAQKLAIINAHYFTPDTSYQEKLLDFMRLLMTPNPEKRPDIRKVIQIIHNWDNINKIELSKEVLEIKAKHIENNKKSSSIYNQGITAEQMNAAMNKISEMEQKKIKKNPYKYQKKDDTDINEVFGEFSECSETKITTHSKLKNSMDKNKDVFDPFNNNKNIKTNINGNGNWMEENKNPNNLNKKKTELDQNNFINFDFIEPASNANNDLFSHSEFKFEVQNNTNKSYNNRSKSPNIIAVNNQVSKTNEKKNTNDNRSKSPKFQMNDKGAQGNQKVYDFFK